jgi:type VI secretion system protein ImpH
VSDNEGDDRLAAAMAATTAAGGHGEAASPAATGDVPAAHAGQTADPVLPALSPFERLQREPNRFSLDQAAAVVAPGQDPVNIDFRSVARLGAPAGEVALRDGHPHALFSPSFGLIGPGGVLPRHYTAWVDAEAKRRSTAMHGFFDLLSRRFTGLYVKAGAKVRPTRNPALAQEVLAAAVGLGTPHLATALATPLPALLHHAGGLSARARSADRLSGMLSEEVGIAVRIVEFTGGWMRLPADEQTRLAALGQPGRHARLGVDASLGEQVWDPASRFTIELGPMPLDLFRSLLPGTPLHTRLVELTRLQTGLEQDFVFNPVLAADAVPPLRLGLPPTGQADTGASPSGAGAARLGWTSWLTSPRPRRQPAAQARLQPHTGTAA